MKLRYLMAVATAPAPLVPFDEEVFGWLSLIGWLALSLGVATRLRPSIVELWPPRRLPGGSEVAALALGLGLAGALTASVVWLFESPRHFSPSASGQPALAAGHVVMGLALALAVLPSMRWLWRARPGGITPLPPLWPCAASLLAALVLGVAAGLLLQLVKGLFGAYPSGEDLSALLLFVPALLICACPAGLIWFRAVHADQTTPLDASGVMTAGLLGACVAFCALVAGGIALLVAPALRETILPGPTTGLVFGLAYALIVMAAWLIAFWPLARLRIDNLLVSAMVLATLAIGVIMSLTPPAMLMTANDWVGFVAVLAIPILAIDVALVLLAGWLIRVVVRWTGRILPA